MENQDPKKIARFVLLGIVVIAGLFLILSSWKDVDPGEEGFLYRPYGGGVDTARVYTEGTQLIAPWNELLTYNVRQQGRSYESQVMDKNGTDIGVFVDINYHAQKGKTPYLHLKHGPEYASSFIDKKVKGAIKDVIGRYTYVEVYSTKREALEQEIENIVETDFNGNFVVLDFVEIVDINLPANIAAEITNKETQKQKNKTAKEKKQEQIYLADARIEKARGDSALVISAEFKAEAIKLEAEQIAKNPQYIELKKWEKWDGVGSPYGSGNVYGNNTGIGILKQN